MEACRNLDPKEIQELIAMGAEVNYVERTNENGWYDGDSTSPLYAALTAHSDVDEKVHIDVIELLFKNKANPSFSA